MGACAVGTVRGWGCRRAGRTLATATHGAAHARSSRAARSSRSMTCASARASGGFVLSRVLPSLPRILDHTIITFCAAILFSAGPTGSQVLSPADRDIIKRCRLAVVECLCAHLEEIPLGQIASPHERVRVSYRARTPILAHSRSCAVPYLFATNPMNHGKP
jgi:hypothetical protein